MIDHMGLAVSDAEKSKAFYEAALAPIGVSLQTTVPGEYTKHGRPAYGFGVKDDPFFWISDGEAVGEGTHVAFRVKTRAEVDAFHAAALAAGGKDNGAPGLRDVYGPNYYAAFVHDFDGINIEAVCHQAD
jgi:catechol 2,3-dioxygenase-like lactoylglutathione lyase family enzyme